MGSCLEFWSTYLSYLVILAEPSNVRDLDLIVMVNCFNLMPLFWSLPLSFTLVLFFKPLTHLSCRFPEMVGGGGVQCQSHPSDWYRRKVFEMLINFDD